MRVLLIKTSSLGDVVHTFPALSDALRAIPAVRFDWVVEEGFAEIAALHPAVERVIPVAVRRWRQRPFSFYRDPAWQSFRAALKAQAYDAIVDAQCLLKSAWMGLLAQGPRYGLDKRSAREPVSAWFYQHPLAVAKGQHAVERTRQLLAQALRYSLPTTAGDYGLKIAPVPTASSAAKRVMFLHGTTWDSKHYPENYWIKLAQIAQQHAWQVCLPWGSETEKARAMRIAQNSEAQVLPKLRLRELLNEIAQCDAVIGVDSGLAHLACALNKPTISLYGPTNPSLTSTYGSTQRSLAAQFPCAPCMQRVCSYTSSSIEKPACFDSLPPATVWQALQDLRHSIARIV